MSAKTFAELYCEREGVSPEMWRNLLFRQTLYPHARMFVGMVRLFNPRHFLADYEFVEDVGYLRSLHDFSLALGSYIEHPSNWSLMRRRLRIRISARRMLAVVRTVLASQAARENLLRDDRHTFEPFDTADRRASAALQTRPVPPAQ